MLSIGRSDIPEFLHKSDFYLALDPEDDSPISVPVNCFKTDTSVEDTHALRHLLQTMRFWGVDEILDEIYDATQLRPYYDAVFAEFLDDFDYLRILLEFRPFLGIYKRLMTAVNAGKLIVVKYLIEKKLTSDETNLLKGRSGCGLAEGAAHQGHLHCLEYLQSVGCDWNSQTCESAASGGQIECLKYARDHGCVWDADEMVEAACKGGSLDCVTYVMDQGCPAKNNTIPHSILLTDNIECVLYLHERGLAWGTQFVSYCTMNNCPKCLKFALAHGCVVHFTAFHRFQTTECVQIIHDSGYVWDATSCAMAARSGDLVILQYLHKLGCPWDAETIKNCMFCTANIDCLRYAHTNGCPWEASAAIQGINHMNRPALMYFRGNGYPFHTIHMRFAARSLEMLIFMHELGLPWHEQVIDAAVTCGNLECVVYALENGCPVDPNVCKLAGEHGHMGIMVYLHNKGFALQMFVVTDENRECALYVQNHLPARELPANVKSSCVIC